MSQEQIDLDSSIGYALKQTATALRVAMDAALRPLALNVSQYSCLELLRQRPGLSASDLARSTFVTRQSMQTLLQGLQERGLLTRRTTAPQGRALPTEITADGARLLARASAAVADVETRMLRDLSPTARTRFLRDLASCTAALGDGA